MLPLEEPGKASIRAQLHCPKTVVVWGNRRQQASRGAVAGILSCAFYFLESLNPSWGLTCNDTMN